MIQSTIRVAIICDAGPSVGLGHLSRMIFLASELNINKSFECSLNILGSLEIQRRQLNQVRYQYISGTLSQALNEVIKEQRPHVIIYDLSLERISEGNSNLFEHVHKKGIFQIGIDNMLRFSEYTDFTLVPAFRINSEFQKYITSRVRWGWDAYLVPVPKNVEPTKNNKLLVLTGASDITGLGNVLPCLLNNHLTTEVEIHWVQGPMAKKPELPEDPRHNWFIHVAPDGLELLMRECSYGLSVYGVSLIELISYHVPSVVLSPYMGKDDEDMKALEDSGIALFGANPEMGVLSLNQLITNFDLFQSIQNTCSQLIRNTGVEIISDRINTAIQQRNKK